ncbi:MAG: phosphatidylglycerol lysyltransferase domain-containing protein [Clostridia bacterium]|nr:phosphatidylglycerol lysyltransferase domain-containing protein [Clostridia bacterium]
MIEFREPQLSDKPAIDAIFHHQSQRLCEYSFGNVFIWRRFYVTRIAFVKGFLLIRSNFRGKPCYIYPAGSGDVYEMLELLREDAAQRGEKLFFSSVTAEMRQTIARYFPDEILYTPLRDYYDYVYRADDLIDLPGKKYHSKRNHITRFARFGEWSYEPLGEGNLEECAAMDDEWCRRSDCNQDDGKRVEHCAVEQAFEHYLELGFSGGLLRQSGRVVAFSMGERLSADTFVTHIEKAFDDVEGAYTMINREFCEHSCEGFTYINREEDLGLDGLRRAKLSYQPAFLLEKGLLEFL